MVQRLINNNSLGTLTARITANTRDFDRKLDESDRRLSLFGGSISSTSALLAGGFVTGAAAAGAALFTLASNAAQAGDEIAKSSRQIDFQIETYQRWTEVLRDAGSSIQTLQTGLGTLNTAAEGAARGVESYTAQFETLGVSIRNANGELASLEELNDRIARSVLQDGTVSSAERQALGRLFGGRAGQELSGALATIGSVENLEAQLAGANVFFDEESALAAERFQDAMGDLRDEMQELTIGIGSAVIPVFAELAEGISGAIRRVTEFASPGQFPQGVSQGPDGRLLLDGQPLIGPGGGQLTPFATREQIDAALALARGSIDPTTGVVTFTQRTPPGLGENVGDFPLDPFALQDDVERVRAPYRFTSAPLDAFGRPSGSGTTPSERIRELRRSIESGLVLDPSSYTTADLETIDAIYETGRTTSDSIRSAFSGFQSAIITDLPAGIADQVREAFNDGDLASAIDLANIYLDSIRQSTDVTARATNPDYRNPFSERLGRFVNPLGVELSTRDRLAYNLGLIPDGRGGYTSRYEQEGEPTDEPTRQRVYPAYNPVTRRYDRNYGTYDPDTGEVTLNPNYVFPAPRSPQIDPNDFLEDPLTRGTRDRDPNNVVVVQQFLGPITGVEDLESSVATGLRRAGEVRGQDTGFVRSSDVDQVVTQQTV